MHYGKILNQAADGPAGHTRKAYLGIRKMLFHSANPSVNIK